MKNRIFNSTLYLITAYFIIHLSRLFSQYVILKFLNMDNLVMYFFYNSYLPPAIKWWTRAKIFIINGAGTIITLIILFLSIVTFIKLSRKKYKLNVFYNWMIILSSSFLIGDFISAPFYKEISPLFNVMRWLNFENGGGGMYLLAILLIPTIPFLGYLTNKSFIKMANTTKWLKAKNLRMKFFFLNAFIPFIFLLATLFIMIYSVYNYPLMSVLSNEGVRMGVLFSILLLGLFFSFNKKYISIQKSNDMHKIDFSLSLFLISAMLSSFILLWLNLS